MRGIEWLLVVVMLVVACGRTVAAGTPGARAAAADAAFVYVMDNGSCYHRVDCPRLRFGRAMPLAQAAKAHRPCPVCILAGSRRGGGARPVIADAPRSAAARAEDVRHEQARPAASTKGAPRGKTVTARSHGHGRAFHAAIGSLIGFGAGFALGYLGQEDPKPVHDPCGELGLGCFQIAFSRSESGLILGALGAGSGAAIGALLPVHREPEALRGRDARRLGPAGRDAIDVAPDLIAASFRIRSANSPEAVLAARSDVLEPCH